MLLDKAADNEKGNIMAEAAATRENEKALKDVIWKFEIFFQAGDKCRNRN